MTRVTAESLERDIRSRGGSVTLAGSITAQTLAQYLGISVRTLEGWRAQGKGPRSYTTTGTAGGRRYYFLADVAAHMQRTKDADESANALKPTQTPANLPSPQTPRRP